MAMKTLDAKIKECRQVVVQNIEPTIRKQMVFKYFKDEKIDDQIRDFRLNTKDAFFTLEFYEAERALEFYHRTSFKEKILLRTFNAYMNIQLAEAEMKKYYFVGASEENIRKFFELANTISICKINIKYEQRSSKLKPHGTISFMKKEEISEPVLKKFKEDLKAIGIELSPYLAEKGLRSSLTLSNFYTGIEEAEDELIRKEAGDQVRKKLEELVGDKATKFDVAINVKRRPDPTSEGGKPTTKITAFVEFESLEATLKNFELIRRGFIKEEKARAVLNFHESEINSYISLITVGLIKPDRAMTDRVFEDKLVDVLRSINKNVVQVTVYPVIYKGIYVGRIYFTDEQSGKQFITEYPLHRDKLVDWFKSENFIFDINVDDRTQKKVKTMEKNVYSIIRGIKNDASIHDRMRNPLNKG